MRYYVMMIAIWSALYVGAQPAAAKDSNRLCSESYIPVTKQKLDSLFYMVSDCKGHISYVLGTLHSSDPEVISSVAYSMAYVKRAQVAWFEIVQNAQSQQAASRRMFLDGTHPGLKTLVTEAEFAQMLTHFRSKVPDVSGDYINRYKPWAAAIALQILAIDTSGVILDDMLQNEAFMQGVEVKSLETVDAQFDMFERLTEEQQVIMLKESIEKFEENTRMSEMLVRYYKQGDLRKIAELAEEMFLAMSDEQIRETLRQVLLVERNNRMVTKLLPTIAEGGGFIAVGALHLPGDSGLLQSFERQGYRIGAVSQ